MTKFGMLMGLCLQLSTSAVEMPRVFGDSMVLQRGQQVPIWGMAKAGEKVSVNFAGQRLSVTANKQGQWRVNLAALKANTQGLTLKIDGDQSEAITYKDVLVGEVWLCSGQSNMRWMLKQSTNAKQEIAVAENSQLRLLDFTSKIYPTSKVFKLADLKELSEKNYYNCNGWKKSNANSASSFSAVAYHFGQQLQKELNVPVGLIHTAIGGTLTESYISRKKLKSEPKLKELSGNWLESKSVGTWCQGRARHNLQAWLKAYPKGKLPHHPFEPGFLFDAGIRPLIPFGIKGCIWYQGESNAPTSTREKYVGGYDIESSKLKMESLIADWRSHWEKPEMPFIYVQLPGLNRPWSLYREMQLDLHLKTKNTGLAVTYDKGDARDVHPKDKKPVGKRLALWAQHIAYADKSVVFSGPIYEKYSVEGKNITLQFLHVGKGQKALASFDAPTELKGFEIAGKDGVFKSAKAIIKGAELVLSSDEVSEPTQARYAWMNDPRGKANFGNKAGLPASPFRTKKISEFQK